MKEKPIIFVALIFIILAFPKAAICDHMDELIENFGNEYKAMIPPPNSSVDTDYKFGQIALGSFYTTKAISLLYQHNQELLVKYDEMLEKYDKIMKQNKEIIRLLSILVKGGSVKTYSSTSEVGQY